MSLVSAVKLQQKTCRSKRKDALPYFVCSSANCISTSDESTLYPFPKNYDLALIWLQRSRREDLLHFLEAHGYVPDNFVLCQEHFADSQFACNTKCSQTLLVTALPTVFNQDDCSSSSSSSEVEEEIIVTPRQQRKKYSVASKLSVFYSDFN